MGNFVSRWFGAKDCVVGTYRVVAAGPCFTALTVTSTMHYDNPSWNFIKRRLVNRCAQGHPKPPTPNRLGVPFVLSSSCNGQPQRLYTHEENIIID
jgi:hypothetical protein